MSKPLDQVTRVIKFRAWDKRTMQIREIETLYFDGSRKCYEIHFTYGTPEVAGMEQVELMQFTGLTDSKGKEIYEGDIYRFYSSRFERVITEVVEWNSDQTMFDCEGEVIGNIYENGDLL